MEDDLKCEKDINEKLEEMDKENILFLPWYWNEGRVKTDKTCFSWADDFVNDLHSIKGLGVRGYLITKGEEDDYYKYVITSKTVREYCGRVVFPRNRYRIIQRDSERGGIEEEKDMR